MESNDIGIELSRKKHNKNYSGVTGLNQRMNVGKPLQHGWSGWRPWKKPADFLRNWWFINPNQHRNSSHL